MAVPSFLKFLDLKKTKTQKSDSDLCCDQMNLWVLFQVLVSQLSSLNLWSAHEQNTSSLFKIKPGLKKKKKLNRGNNFFVCVLVPVTSWRVVTVVHICVSWVFWLKTLKRSEVVVFAFGKMYYDTMNCDTCKIPDLRILHAFILVCVCVPMHATSWPLRSSKFRIIKGMPFYLVVF